MKPDLFVWLYYCWFCRAIALPLVEVDIEPTVSKINSLPPVPNIGMLLMHFCGTAKILQTSFIGETQ